MVLNVPDSQEWYVTVGGRIEDVTDQEVFPELFRGALARADEIPVIWYVRSGWPHTTSLVVRLSASDKKDAEFQAQRLVLPVFLGVAKELLGVDPFGWTISVDAKPAPDVPS
jgi:hypothetical protein